MKEEQKRQLVSYTLKWAGGTPISVKQASQFYLSSVQKVRAFAGTSVNDMIGNGEDLLIVSGRKCRCGSTQHQRTSHKDCPLNKKRKK